MTKERSQNHGNAGDFCTITGSNLNAIDAGTKVIYTTQPHPSGWPTSGSTPLQAFDPGIELPSYGVPAYAGPLSEAARQALSTRPYRCPVGRLARDQGRAGWTPNAQIQPAICLTSAREDPPSIARPSRVHRRARRHSQLFVNVQTVPLTCRDGSPGSAHVRLSRIPKLRTRVRFSSPAPSEGAGQRCCCLPTGGAEGVRFGRHRACIAR